jgi:dipeptidyl-peptidase-4
MRFRLKPRRRSCLQARVTGNNNRARLAHRLALMICLLTTSHASANVDKPRLSIERLYAAPDLSGTVPREVRISPDSSRVIFLKSKESDPLQMDLWEYSLEDNSVRLLVDSAQLITGSEELSEEELARRERLRTVGQRGIVTYQISPRGDRVLFPLNGEIFLHDFESRELRQLTATPAAETDPRFSSTGRYVSFIREQNLFIVDLDNGCERQITHDGGGVIRNGMAEFIAQEEMDRYTGYWWAPDDSAIAFTRVDESPVQVARRFEIHADDFVVYEQRYPAAGTPNALIQLGVAEPGNDEIRWMDIGDDTDIYLARVTWFPDSDYLAVERQSRDQQTLDLLKINAESGNSRTLLTETSDTWINLHNELRFLESRPQFIWSSERSGHTHLYLYDNDGGLIRALTGGEWDVVDGERSRSALLHVDESNNVLYATATLDSPMERNVYAIPLDGNESPTRISQAPGWHKASFAKNGKFYVDAFNNPTTPPQLALHRSDGRRIGFIEENALDNAHPYHPYLASQPSTEFGTLEAADGQTLYYRIKKPADLDPEKQYPVVVIVYGGPQGQRITRTWSAGFEEVLTDNGYIVFSLDNRGTGFRGTAFDAPIFKLMGQVEVTDQLLGVKYLASLDYVDSGRIGIYGWSYGSYMTLMCMVKNPGVFAAGISGAPVTDWTLYDTHYTERYLGKPQDNAAGYRASAVFPYLENLADPLLVIHGMADDNVLFTHSTKLFKALQDHGLPFDAMTYPGSKHALGRVPATGKHLYAHILRFFRHHLR